jgi:hypothetical protein
MKKLLSILLVAGLLSAAPFLMGALTVDQILNNVYDSTETALKFYMIYDEVIGDFTVDTNTLHVDSTNNRVGVGTATPDELFHAETTTALTNAVSTVGKIAHATSGTEANGIGLELQFAQETTGGEEIGAEIEVVTTDVTSTSEDFDIVFKNMDAGAAADETVRFDSDGAIHQTMTGTVKRFVYQADAMADDAEISLPDATDGIVLVQMNAEAMFAIVNADGTSTKISGSTNTAVTDSDTDLCVYDGGTAANVKNRLGATAATRVVYWYN